MAEESSEERESSSEARIERTTDGGEPKNGKQG
jgi:hypothetical protein